MKEFNLSNEKKLAIEKAKNFKKNSDYSNCYYDCYNCPNCSNCSNCFNCAYCFNCSYCSDCFDCSDCSDCLDKKYMICNVQFTKEEYEAWKKNLI